MKIRLLVDARQLGGVETHVMTLCHELCRRNHDCKIIFMCHYPNNILYQVCDEKKIAYEFCHSYYALLKQLIKEKPAIIHTHGYKAHILGRLLPVISKAKIVATFHGGEKQVGKLALYNFLDRWSSFLSHNISVNGMIAAQLPFFSYELPNFVNIPPKPNSIKAEGPYNIYYIGRFNPEKNPLRFCELSKLLPQEFKCFMVGDGPLLSDAQHQYQSTISFSGAIKNMDEIWPNVDLLCITSDYEGLPLVLLEAMSRGIPVISFDVGNVKEIIVDKNYVIEPADLESMRACLLSHFMKPVDYRETMSQTARTKIMKQFSSEIIVPQIEDLYARICL